MNEKITTRTLLKMKQKGEKIASLTAYDFLTARLLDECGIDLILVGDSAAMVFAGYEESPDRRRGRPGGGHHRQP